MFFRRKKKQRDCRYEDIDLLLLDLFVHYDSQDEDDYYEKFIHNKAEDEVRLIHKKMFGSDPQYYP